MKKTNRTVPAPSKLNLLRQIGNFIPDFLVPRLARQTGAQQKIRTFSAWSHVVALLYAQLTHSIGLNDVCDALALHSEPLSSLRGATPPSCNNLSHANQVRPAQMAEQLFWAVFEHLGQLSPRFVSGQAGKRCARKFHRTVHWVDSTTIPLIASCLDWAKHRRRKAAAKCHLRLDLQSFLPRFAIVDTARHNDNRRARELCAGIKAGEIAIFDKAYVDFDHWADLSRREVFWVTRAKDNLGYRVVRRYQRGAVGKILRDDLIRLSTPASRRDYPELLRRVVALVEVDGREVRMEFLSNHLQWSATSVVELYRCRWQIEVFFKQIKQTWQLADFLGTSANAVRGQVWMAPQRTSANNQPGSNQRPEINHRNCRLDRHHTNHRTSTVNRILKNRYRRYPYENNTSSGSKKRSHVKGSLSTANGHESTRITRDKCRRNRPTARGGCDKTVMGSWSQRRHQGSS